MGWVAVNDSYESSTLDAVQLRSHAREVAQRVLAEHPLPAPASAQQFSGWDLGRVVEEGIRDGKINFERGWLFFLRVDGELMCAEYVVNPLVGGDPDDPLGTGDFTLIPMADQAMTYLDRPNQAGWRSMRSTTPNVHQREELGTNYQIIVATKGQALSDALQELDRHPRPARRIQDRKNTGKSADLDKERRERIAAIPRELWELTKVAVPVALGAPIVYMILLGTWSEKFAKALDWNNPHPEPGESPADALVLQGILVAVMLACLAALGYLLPYKKSNVVFSAAAGYGTALGTALFFWQIFNGSGGMASWFWPPLCTVLGHLAYGLYRQSTASGPTT